MVPRPPILRQVQSIRNWINERGKCIAPNRSCCSHSTIDTMLLLLHRLLAGTRHRHAARSGATSRRKESATEKAERLLGLLTWALSVEQVEQWYLVDSGNGHGSALPTKKQQTTIKVEHMCSFFLIDQEAHACQAGNHAQLVCLLLDLCYIADN